MTRQLNIDKPFQERTTRTTAYKRRLAQWRMKWLIEQSNSHQNLWCIDSFVPTAPSSKTLAVTLLVTLQTLNRQTNERTNQQFGKIKRSETTPSSQHTVALNFLLLQPHNNNPKSYKD
jgi:hypothetical protein